MAHDLVALGIFWAPFELVVEIIHGFWRRNHLNLGRSLPKSTQSDKK
jgi:hypothetical protein